MSDSWTSAFNIKNGVEYKGNVGYRLYNEGDYNINTDSFIDQGWSAETAAYSGMSDELSFYFWNIEGGATGILSASAAILTLIEAF